MLGRYRLLLLFTVCLFVRNIETATAKSTAKELSVTPPPPAVTLAFRRHRRVGICASPNNWHTCINILSARVSIYIRICVYPFLFKHYYVLYFYSDSSDICAIKIIYLSTYLLTHLLDVCRFSADVRSVLD